MGSGLSDAPSRALPVEPGAQPLASLIDRLRAHVRYEYMPAAARLAMDEAASALERLTGAWSEVDRLAAANQRLFTEASRVLEPFAEAQVRSVAFAPLEDSDAMFATYTVKQLSFQDFTAAAGLLRKLREPHAPPIRHDARDGASPQNNGAA